MTRRSVYGAGLVAFLAATALTLASIIVPRWIVWNSGTTSGPSVHYSYGLHSRCSSVKGTCVHFPDYDTCHGRDRHFCNAWRSVGFLVSFAFVLEIATFVSFLVIMLGGRAKRESGWRVLCSLLLFCAAAQALAMSVVAWLVDRDDRFQVPGWKLGQSWILCTVSWSVLLLSAIGIGGSACVLPSEGDYELIPDRPVRGS